MSQTLFDIVNEIKPKKIRSGLKTLFNPKVDSTFTFDDSSQQQKHIAYHQAQSKKWTEQEQKILFDLFVTYGTDFSLILSYFPGRSRKQIKKKFNKIEKSTNEYVTHMIEKKHNQRKKSFFEEEILEITESEIIEQLNKSKPKPKNN